MSDADREVLRSWVRSPSSPSGLVTRARIVLLASEGTSNTEIARRLELSRQTVVTWRGRYRSAGLAGLEDRPRSGRPGTVDEAEVVVRNPGGPAGEARRDPLVLPAARRRTASCPTSRWPRCGASGRSSPGGVRRSSSPPIRNWRPRSAMWSGCIWPRRRRRWWSAWIRSPRSRRWIGPPRCCR